jgi:hypothetical protein
MYNSKYLDMIHILIDIFIFINKFPHKKRNLSLEFSQVSLQSLKKLRENLIREDTLVLAACAHSVADADEDYLKLDISCYHTLRF